MTNTFDPGQEERLLQATKFIHNSLTEAFNVAESVIFDSKEEFDYYYDEYDEPFEDDVWADANALASAGFGTFEDYGCYDLDDDW